MVLYDFCFSDEDEVGDRITVRSDDELKAMLSYVSIGIGMDHLGALTGCTQSV